MVDRSTHDFIRYLEFSRNGARDTRHCLVLGRTFISISRVEGLMLPITSFLSCKSPIDELERFSYHQKYYTKTYVTGLVAAATRPWTASLPAFFRRKANARPTVKKLIEFM